MALEKIEKLEELRLDIEKLQHSTNLNLKIIR